MTQRIVYQRVQRPDAALIMRAAACAMSDLYEAMDAAHRDAALLHLSLRPVVAGIRMTGPAVTVQCAPGDNLMMHRAPLLAATVEKAETRQAHEQQGIAEINAGRSLFEVHDLQTALARSGVVRRIIIESKRVRCGVRAARYVQHFAG
jgi:regulator of RNase E activity RraA